MSVTYLFVGGPSHGKLVVWRERVSTIEVPIPFRRPRVVGEEEAYPEPRKVEFDRATYLTEEVHIVEFEATPPNVYSIDVAVWDRLGQEFLGNRLKDAMLRSFPGRRKETYPEFAARHEGHDW